MTVYEFKYCRVEVDDAARTVTTVFADGGRAVATREDTPENRAEAEAEGYAGGDVWRCLVEHELVHCYLAETIWGKPSPVLRTECGDAHPYWLRMYEEALVISFQIYLNSLEAKQPLHPFRSILEVWAGRFRQMQLQPSVATATP